MANTDSAFGFKPVGHLLGLDWSAKIRWYYVPATYATAIYKYDLVVPGGASGVNAEATGKYPIISQAAAADTILLGSAVAFQTTPPSSEVTSLAGASTDTMLEYKPASTACYVGVTDDPYVIYEAQEDGTLTVNGVMGNADIVVGSGSSTTGLSAMEIDSSDQKAATAQIRILRLAGDNTDRNNAIGANAKWLCMINEHTFKAGTAGPAQS